MNTELERLIGIVNNTVVYFMVNWFRSLEGNHICATSKIPGKNDKMAKVDTVKWKA